LNQKKEFLLPQKKFLTFFEGTTLVFSLKKEGEKSGLVQKTDQNQDESSWRSR